MEETGLPDGYDNEAFERCKGIFWGLIEDPEKVVLTITSDFRGTVRELTEDKAYAAAYEQSRPQAFALAKTIPISDGTQHVVVFADVLLESKPYGPPEATFEHEALHVEVAQRGESLYDLRLRLAAEGLELQGDLVAMAGVACEEYRVERVLAAAGHEGRIAHSSGFEESARRLYRETETGVRLYAQNRDLRALAGIVLNEFHALTTASGYLAAELAAAGLAPAEINFAQEVEDLVLGERWREVLGALMEVPAADKPTDPGELEALAFTVAERLSEWLEEFGFEVFDRDGNTNFMVLNPMQWHLNAGL
jgi:hypothetical protein